MAAAARKNDLGVPHCSTFRIQTGSDDVYINDRPAARERDSSTPHLRPARRCVSHVSRISRGSRSVYINGRPAARVDDPFAGCTRVAQGSPNVDIGD